MRTRAPDEPCQLCGRKIALTFHHLIPRKMHRRPRFYKQYTREQLNQGIWVCRACHRGIHKHYDEMTLARDYNTLEQLQTDSQLQKHVAWVAKQRQA
ncbi:HNH endonuclease [Marinobacterium sediminicola]|uniref:HNH endonuclease n=1 Tax=Marinobacterium sediminicola TaxID=518898 RepID=A0ABY1S2R7_9GAMM|nr:HNH endonuclease [Marinobacterium sediminicola]ULG68854.1 HNH endonuclease [Marinobacterium sediminicola]SMR77536.1 HNH endonuclease [Marinobacterium sediminicola]